jgi:hypothetical protein
MGWTPERVTEYEHDEQGRVVRSTEYIESAWDEHERGLMLALAEWEATRCPMCGGDPAECQAPESDINNQFGKWAYHPDLPIECYRATAARKLKQDPEDRRALIPQVKKLPRGAPAPRTSW